MTTLADRINQLTYTSPNKFSTKTFGRIDARTPLLRYRDLIRRAARFVIDDDMMDMMVQQSMGIERTGNRLAIARLPYEVVWLEFDRKKHVAAQHAHSNLADPLDLDSVPDRSGYLLVRVPDNESRYVVYATASYGDTATIAPIVFFVDVDNPIAVNYRAFGSRRISDALASSSLIGSGGEGAYSEILAAEQTIPVGFWSSLAIEDHPWLRHVAAGIEPIAMQHLNALRDLPRGRFEEAAKVYIDYITRDLREQSGIVRQLLALLAMINEVPTETAEVDRGGGHRTVGMNKVRFLNHTKIRLKVPKTRSADYRRKGRHMVRGHFRRFRLTGSATCSHGWQKVDHDLFECPNCGAKGRWIKEHARGDASKGWVQHEYVVEAS